MARDRLDKAALDDALRTLDGWSLAGDGASIARTFRFRDFSEAFAFMARSALAAEKLDHHPNWSNVYNTVEVKLFTHDRDGVTSLDIDLARLMNGFAAH